MIEYAVLGGFVLDCLFGDPAWLPHPVVYMGKAISALEKRLRARLPKTPQGELLGGAIVAFCLPVGTFLLTSLVCLGAARISPWLGLAVQMFWCGQALAAKGLAQESTNVYRELVKPDLPAARRAVSRIVGRDTQDLTLEGVTKAAVETVAENASDGVIAPLLYMLIGGAPLALTYKAINTMDSMLGYKNEKYLYFGRAAAKLDDVANYLPSRIAGLLWAAAAALTRHRISTTKCTAPEPIDAQNWPIERAMDSLTALPPAISTSMPMICTAVESTKYHTNAMSRRCFFARWPSAMHR